MKKKRVLLLALVAFASTGVYAQARGGAQGGSSRGQGQGQGQQTPRTGRQSGQGAGAQDRGAQRDQARAQTTDQQRDQYRTCDQSMDRARTMARDMAQDSGGKGFNADRARQQRDQLREQFQTMEQEHQRLLQGLTADQGQFVQQRTGTMEQIQERINTRLQEMNQELEMAAPDGKRVAEQARTIEREMKAWQDQHRAMGGDLALK
jgi:hypothetical protein